MQQFPEVYVEALNRLQTKINEEDASIQLFEQNNSQLNELLTRPASNRQIKEERQFVFKINVVEGIFSRNPIFQLQIDTNESAEILFQDFDEGDAMLSLPISSNVIHVRVLNEQTKDTAYEFSIELTEFSDKRRQLKHTAGHYNNADVVIEYEGQIIYNQADYHRGLLYINSQKIEDSKQNKYDYTRMRDDLLAVFKDQNLRASVIKASSIHQSNAPQSGSQYEILGQTPVLKNNQMKASFITKEFKINDSDISGSVTHNAPVELGVFGSGVKTNAPSFQKLITSSKLSWSYFVHLLFFISVGLLVVSFLVNWDRASFLSMFMAVLVLTWYFLKEEYDSLLPAWFLLIGFLMAFVLDLLWLIMVSTKLWASESYIHDGSLSWVDKFTIIMTYVIVGIEFVAILLCALLQYKGMFTNAKESLLKPALILKI